MKKRLANLDTGYLNEYGTRLESQLSSAKQLFKEARDAGDSEKEFEAQQALAKITVEQERYRLAKQRQEIEKARRLADSWHIACRQGRSKSAHRGSRRPPKASWGTLEAHFEEL